MLPEFIEWANVNLPEFKETDIDGFILFAISGMSIGGSGTWVAVDSKWEMHFIWTSLSISWFLIRRMGEKEPAYCFVENRDNHTFTEIKPGDYIGEYSHTW
jgi:hypothetical protein